ncbi:Translation machinery-associated protein 46 like [Verticillium longisporum]|uniref:Translation machinery-associated protein 46 like n=1 Tax=Verticillium longisporum TaxID=100787 RepID=A0A8I2ZRF9_VERLO|nr:Translation machinery-associated protein 46 like [Verticillium longisporum]
MPPKKNIEKPAKAKGAQAVADKTFGMKNKKGGAAQKQIAQLSAMAKSGGTPEEKRKQAEKAQREKEKRAAEEAKRELADLVNKPAQIQKVPFGVDPKTVSLYTDTRAEEDEQKKVETSAEWDEEKLRSVVLSKKGNQKTTTDKVCKFFVEAIEEGKYGWFWVCPNGGDKCMYKHALPPGFVLKTKEQRAAEKALMDKHPYTSNARAFAKWKKERLDKKAAEEQAKKAKEATGRAMFESGTWKDDDESGDEDDDDNDAWNMEKLRAETEAARERKEAERVAALHGTAVGAMLESTAPVVEASGS